MSEFKEIKHKYIKMEKIAGVDLVLVLKYHRIIINQENTLKDLIDLLKETLDIYKVMHWLILDKESGDIAEFGESMIDLPETNIKDLKITGVIRK